MYSKSFTYPFPYIEIKNVYSPQKATNLLKAVLKESFHPKEADLFKFKQTSSLVESKNKSIQEFIKELRSKIVKITNLPIDQNKLDISASLYEDTDFLLCHDDQLEKRGVAFIYYLSSLRKKEGGALALFLKRKELPLSVAKRIQPTFNTLIVFPVTASSFHAVEEVVSKKQRIALSGWFYEN